MSIEERLTGGHPNSLGNTVEIVNQVLQNPTLFDELFQCYYSEDEVVRLRVSNAMKRICREDEGMLIPYIDNFLDRISQIDQASTQWTLAQLFLMLEKRLSKNQRTKAEEILKVNLVHHQDWIVLNMTMETLGQWANKDETLRTWMKPHLNRLSKDPRKSVSKKAVKTLQMHEGKA